MTDCPTDHTTTDDTCDAEDEDMAECQFEYDEDGPLFQGVPTEPPVPLDPMEQLVQSNNEGLQRLAAQGVDVAATLNSVRLTVLLDALLPPGGTLRSTYDAMFQANVAAMIEQGEKQLVRDKLTAGVGDGPPPLQAI